MLLVIHLLAFFCCIIYLNNTQLVIFPSHENNLIFFLLTLIVRIFCNAAKVPNIHPFFLLFKITLTFQKYCTIFLIESPLDVMRNVFYFVLQAFHVLKILKFLSQHFSIVGKTALLER